MLQWRRIIFSGHAIRRMFQWKIGSEEVTAVLRTGETIMEYPEDKPFQSRLLLGFSRDRPFMLWQPSIRLRKRVA